MGPLLNQHRFSLEKILHDQMAYPRNAIEGLTIVVSVAQSVAFRTLDGRVRGSIMGEVVQSGLFPDIMPNS